MREVDSWTQALYSVPPVICGLRLRPFSLAHTILLRGINNPYAYVGLAASRDELLAAILICSRTHAENQAALFGGGQRALPLLRWAWRWRRMDISTADASFRQYIKDGTRFPQYKDSVEGGKGDPPVAPVEWHLHRHLCCDRGWGDENAWNCSHAYARHLFDVWAESQGHGALASEYEARLIELDAAQREAEARGDAEARDRAFAEMADLVKRNRESRHGC